VSDVFSEVKSALTGLSVPMWAGAYLGASGELPDVFLIYSLISDYPAQHADNTEQERAHRVQVSIYSRTGLESLPNVVGAMTAAGWMTGQRRMLPYQQQTGHHCLAIDFVKI